MQTFGQPRGTVPPWLPDVLVTVAVAFLSVPPLVASHVRLAIGVPLLVLSVSPLLLRRRRPVAVFVTVTIVVAVSMCAATRLGLQLAPVVALIAVAATSPRRIALAAAGLLEVAVLVAATQLPGPWWLNIFLLSAIVAAALARGFYLGARQAFVLQMQERALHLERERDQQGALAAAAERSRIAREMHDIVAHHLTVIVALSGGAAALATQSPERAAEAMRAVSDTGRQALEETRRLLGVLRDDTHEIGHTPPPGLAQLDELVERVRAAGLPTTFTITGAQPSMSDSLQITLYRIAQEALTNVLKHGGSDVTASVHLDCSADQVVLDVRNESRTAPAPPVHVGAPFTKAGAVSATVGRGVLGMTERVNAFGGELSTGPVRTGGWFVTARLPVAR